MKSLSAGWLLDFFQAAADPYREAQAHTVAFHLDPDRLRHEYEALGMKLVVVESANRALIKVISADSAGLLRMSPDKRIEVISRISAMLLNVRGHWMQRDPSSPDEAVGFSTAPGRDTRFMPFWDSRVDAGVYKGELYYLCYKKPSQMFGFPPETDWYSKEFREKHGSKRK